MQQRLPLLIVDSAVMDARDHYRWLLLAGWFVLTSTVLSFVVATPRHVQPLDGALIALAAVAFIVYTIAVKRYGSIGLGILVAFIAVMWSIVA